MNTKVNKDSNSDTPSNSKPKTRLPNSKESESIVLGSMINNVNHLNSSIELLDERDFYFPEHRILFKEMKISYAEDKGIDVFLLSQALTKKDELESVGGVPYITYLSQFAGTSVLIEEYAKIIKQKAILRELIKISQTIEAKSISEKENAHEILEEAQSYLFKLGQTGRAKKEFLLSDMLTGTGKPDAVSFMSIIESRQERFKNAPDGEAIINGIQSHFIDLDKTIGGLNKGNLIILAARPSMGKTAFALNMAVNVCFKNKIPVGVFSLEMTAEQLLERIVCSESGVSSNKVRTGNLTPTEYQNIYSSIQDIKQHTMVIEDEPGLSITKLRARARRMKEAYNIEFMVVDYLQLITGSFRGSQESRQVEISEISRTLKNIARELNIPILCLAQLSRKVEERPSHIPQLSDLRESGSIEQDADAVMFLLRRDYYNPNDKPGTADVIVAKNRHGETKSFQMVFNKELMLFRNYVPNIALEDNDY